jgi:hypothetical protein
MLGLWWALQCAYQLDAEAHLVSRPASNLNQPQAAGLILPICLGTAVFLGVVVGYRVVGFNVLRSDVAEYVNWSRNLAGHSYPSHMPGYPALIALVRWGTFGLISDLALAQGICLLGWSGAVVLFCHILRSLAAEAKEIGVLCYALAPFVGVFYTAYPIADIPAHAVFLAAVWCAVQARWWMFAGATAAGLLIHQAFYPFYFLLALVCLFSRGMKWIHLAASAVPFCFYYAWMAVSRGDANWMLHYHGTTHVKSRRGLVVFDGVVGSLLQFTPKEVAKGFLLLAISVGAVFLAVYFLRRKNWLQLSLVLPVLFYAAISNDKISFLLIRLSKLLVLPACVWAAGQPRLVAVLQRRFVYWLVASCLIATQFVWAAYTVVYLSK